MGLISSIKKFVAQLKLSDPKAWDPSLWQFAYNATVSGENVNEYNAFDYSAFYNAVSLIAGTTASLPLNLLQRKNDRTRMADNHSLYTIMHDQWNPYMTAMAGRECLMSHVLTWGNGYAEIVRNPYTMNIQELWPITPNRVKMMSIDGMIVYEIQTDSGKVFLPREKVLHVPGMGFDGFLGYSVVNLARKSIGLSKAMETFGARFFGSGTHPGLVVIHPNALGEQASKNLRNSLNERYSGLGQAHKILLLEEGMKVEKIGIPPEDSQFLESREFQVNEIARWFNLPPHKIKDLKRSTYSNVETQQIEFYQDAIRPWLVRLEQNYNMQLLSDGDRGQYGAGRLYFNHNFKGLLRGDIAAQGQFYKEMFNIGVFSVNDIRRLEDLDPVDGGDIHLVPLNMTTLENAGKPKALPPKPPNGDGANINTDNPDDGEARRSAR